MDDLVGWRVALGSDGSPSAASAFAEDSGSAGIDGERADAGTDDAGAVFRY
jgi:hypothetical protein